MPKRYHCWGDNSSSAAPGKSYTLIMEVIVAAFLFSIMGFIFLALSKNENVLSLMRKGHPNNDVVHLVAKFTALFSFALSGVCTLSAVLSFLGLF